MFLIYRTIRNLFCSLTESVDILFTLNIQTSKLLTMLACKICLNTTRCVANNVNPDHLIHSVESDMGLHCLLTYVCPNIFQTYFHLKSQLIKTNLPASVAQLDARLTGDQEVASLTPAEVGNILSLRLIMKYFLWSFSPFRRFKRAVVSFWRKNVHNTG